ncbi:MAG: hypothetical protein LQ338_006242 [Usnochroma carphineum]|nr:MAG: hypothetical protein LQ338_006242 [Usnochroma carphineum]
MARQKSARPKSRNLVRWSDDMDKKLLLTIQWACNKKGVKIPWETVGREMGETITESAVVQHMAKLRQRMVNDNLPVPPPLTRRGRNEKPETKRKTDVKKPNAYRVNKRVAKKKVVNSTEDETDSDGAYKTEEDVANDAIEKGKKKAESKSRIKKEPSTPELIRTPNATQDDGEQSYGVGDSMWDLAAKPTARAKAGRMEPESSGQSSKPATKVVKLKIGKQAVAKLALPEHMDYSPTGDDSGMSVSDDESHTSTDEDEGLGEGFDNGDSDASVGDYEPDQEPSAPYGQDTGLAQLHAAGYGSEPHNQVDAKASPGPIEPPAPQSDALGMDDHHNISHGPNDPDPFGTLFFPNHAAADMATDPAYNTMEMPSYDDEDLFTGPAGMSSFGNEQDLAHGFFENEPSFFDNSFHGPDMSSLNDATANEYDMDVSYDHDNGNLANAPAAAADFAGFGMNAYDPTYQFDQYQHVHTEHDNQTVQSFHNQSQDTAKHVLGSPFQAYTHKPEQHQDSLESANSFHPAVGDFAGFGNSGQGGY